LNIDAIATLEPLLVSKAVVIDCESVSFQAVVGVSAIVANEAAVAVYFIITNSGIATFYR
jgi:hypothetical protein